VPELLQNGELLSAAGRLSHRTPAPLVAVLAASLSDRLAHHVPDGTADESTIRLFELSGPALLALAHHALNAALETLDSHPDVASELLPSTAARVRAQIAHGCMADVELRALGYVLAEIDLSVWQQLLRADRATAPTDTLSNEEIAERLRMALTELGLTEADALHYRQDRRVALILAAAQGEQA